MKNPRDSPEKLGGLALLANAHLINTPGHVAVLVLVLVCVDVLVVAIVTVSDV